MSRRQLRKLGFLHIVPFERDDAERGLRETLELFEFAEALGLDGGWVRSRHLQYGLPSASVFLAAAAQRTSRIDLGAAVIPTVYETPLRLAEDLSVADLLSGGRLQPGLSVGPSRHPAEVEERIFGPDADRDVTYGRIERTLAFIRGDAVDVPAQIGIGGVTEWSSDRIEPHSPGLASRLWYGGGSLRSAAWAGDTGLRLLVSNISTGEDTDVFDRAQRQQIDLFRSRHPQGEQAVVSKGHVVIPTDRATPEQVAKYTAYVEGRTPRTRVPQPNRRLIATDVFGSTEQIVDRLSNDLGFQAVDEFLFELPFSFDPEDYRHILREFAEHIGPALGWRPATERAGAAR
ncbi:LLM class flavin-dependent oxidoreductase [uncultured Amnibacterium sp.]|uniref:LLM class flavin-dependent oxidoreductase n=1 Tax=uncultured Amnibacterium sp. TaxID=1631851 RepID=UPI0035CBC4B6